MDGAGKLASLDTLTIEYNSLKLKLIPMSNSKLGGKQ